jgi:hypothetical protein
VKPLLKPVGSPGVIMHRRYTNYTPYQEALWQAFDDTYHAAGYGFQHTRQPSPFEDIDPGRFERWQERAVLEWGKESRRDLSTRGPERDSLPRHLWLYMYSRMVAATQLKG